MNNKQLQQKRYIRMSKNMNKTKAISLSFYKKVKCWYAEVPEHTEAQNLMVAGADQMCEAMASGKKRVSVDFVADAATTPKGTIVHLQKISQTAYGATYSISTKVRLGVAIPNQCWLCNVTKTVCGGYHPDSIDVVAIRPNDALPYEGKPPKMRKTA